MPAASARPVPSPSPSDSRARETFAEPAEIDAFVAELGRFERGEIDAEAWRAYRVARGVYGQRQDDFHMLRVKIPQGVAGAEQLRALADVAERWSRGFGHVTTRQNVQFHFVRQDGLEPALRRLAEAGITSAAACGNTVRNVVACPHAGVAAGEVFDVTPYAEALTRHFLRHPLAWSLPRKFKIAFEGCADDHVATPIHDLGFRARVREDGGVSRRGFAVTVAGGTATVCTSGAVLAAFLPAGDVLALTEAVIRIFHARGDRANRKRARLKFLVRDLGIDAFRALVEEELASIRAERPPRLPFDPDRAPEELPPAHARPAPPSLAAIAARVSARAPRGPGLPPAIVPVLDAGAAARALFRRTNVTPQRQRGHSVVTVALPQGDVTGAQLEVLADLALAHGDGTVRFTSAGRAALRWVPDDRVDALWASLAAAGLGRTGPGSAADVVSCPGAEACKLAVTHSRGVARLAEERVRARLGEAAETAPLPVHVSGCPNGCSQHHLAAIGLQGSARKLGGRAVPQYFVTVGGGVTDGGARFAKLAGKVPARRVPEAVERLTALYLAERDPGEAAGDFFARSLERAKAAIAELEALRPEDAVPEDFEEPGTTGEFRPTA